MSLEPKNRRCETCTANSRAIFGLMGTQRNKTVWIQPTFAALRCSAREGCDLCRLMEQSLAYSSASKVEYDALEQSAQRIVLWYSPASTFKKAMFPPSNKDNFAVSCSAFPKWHISLIPFLCEPVHDTEGSAGSNNVGEKSGENATLSATTSLF